MCFTLVCSGHESDLLSVVKGWIDLCCAQVSSYIAFSKEDSDESKKAELVRFASSFWLCSTECLHLLFIIHWPCSTECLHWTMCATSHWHAVPKCYPALYSATDDNVLWRVHHACSEQIACATITACALPSQCLAQYARYPGLGTISVLPNTIYHVHGIPPTYSTHSFIPHPTFAD